MSVDHNYYYNLAERLDDLFSEIDAAACVDLRKNNSEYAEMMNAMLKLEADYPIISQITEREGDVSLSVDECRALARYLVQKNEMENIERKQVYFRGHMDNYHFLKKIGAL